MFKLVDRLLGTRAGPPQDTNKPLASSVDAALAADSLAFEAGGATCSIGRGLRQIVDEVVVLQNGALVSYLHEIPNFEAGQRADRAKPPYEFLIPLVDSSDPIEQSVAQEDSARVLEAWGSGTHLFDTLLAARKSAILAFGSAWVARLERALRIDSMGLDHGDLTATMATDHDGAVAAFLYADTFRFGYRFTKLGVGNGPEDAVARHLTEELPAHRRGKRPLFVGVRKPDFADDQPRLGVLEACWRGQNYLSVQVTQATFRSLVFPDHQNFNAAKLAVRLDLARML